LIPEGAKWRLGHAERHGAILNLMLMKMVRAHNLVGYEDARMATVAACIAKNRLSNHGGVSPLQAVTGKNNVLPASIMNQLCSGKVKCILNDTITRTACLQRAERIRSAAVESFIWLDSHQSLRKALASKSRPPQLELLREGATVYVYDPPPNRQGLARRLQDNSSWSGPGTVICVEKDKEVPTRVWVRLRGRVRGVPLERLRLATTEEVVSNQFITEALEEVQKELTSGQLRIAGEEGDQQPAPAGSSLAIADEPAQPMEDEEQETEQMRLERRLLTDVPLQMTRKVPGEGDPSNLPFAKKQKVFEQLSKQMGAPTTMQEASIRERLEDAYQRSRSIRKDVERHKSRSRARASAQHDTDFGIVEVDVTENEAASRNDMASEEEVALENAPVLDSSQAFVIAAKALKYELFVVEAYKKDTYDVMAELKFHGALWSEPGKYAGVQQLEAYAQQQAQDGAQAAQQGGLVTGKDRLEYAWSKLDDRWRQAYIPALRKALKVYIDHAAIKGVPEGKVIDPKRILPSRMVLTNKGKPQLEAAELKARWVFGGHRDPDAGAYPTASPTVSLVGHNLLNFLAVQFRWEIFYEDVSAAFLQGKELPPQREIYVKIPYGYTASDLAGILWHGLPR